MTFSRQGYQKTVLSTSALDDVQRATLLCLSVYCADDLTVKVRDWTSAKLTRRLKWAPRTARRALQSLRDTGLLQSKRVYLNGAPVMHYELPSEDVLSKFTGPKR